ncbi:hypothetical protein D9619_011662 [Psilocybe cf. subviscida]|uniref:Uncharacterized protein n=1 Tax=Psilocybe cf. subviscida TaxID=2480587 RepID=A0A8H5BT25_9AGAR|nr:hypothetical protein D9619_011662 [Psilocybe cf. subviscida]
MTNGPPSSAAGSSKTPVTSLPSSAPPANGSGSAAYSVPFASWPPSQPGLAQVSSSPQNLNSQIRSYYRDTTYGGQEPTQGRIYQTPYATKQPPTPAAISTIQNVPTRSISIPPPPEPETYKHWDNAIKKFLVCANLMQTLDGLENDMLVLNFEWEQTVIPKALKELQADLQHILDRVEGKQKVEDIDIDIESTAIEDTEPLDERKLEYAILVTGKPLRSQSSINHSISQFLAKTRARNDASNRAEFLYTLAEKKRKLQEALGPEAAAEIEVSSCARVDAKPIDRDKQMKYDIAKNGDGPLTRTVKSNAAPPMAPSSLSCADHPSAPTQTSLPAASSSISVNDALQPTKKRKYGEVEDPEYSLEYASAKRKGKGREYGNEDPEVVEADREQRALAAATAEKHPGLDERLKNIEAHLALRYVPTPPRTLLARLKYLEDHIVRLEKEYPPWAALHFNQPDRGWPAPPRTTPIIVPPQLRLAPPELAQVQRPAAPAVPSVASMDTATAPPTEASFVASGSNVVMPPAPPPISIPKSRRATSSLQQAILDRLEVQKAMNELKNGRDT